MASVLVGGLDETWSEPPGRAVRPEAASSVGPIAIHYWASLRPCLGTAIAPRRRARFRQTLLVVIRRADPSIAVARRSDCPQVAGASRRWWSRAGVRLPPDRRRTYRSVEPATGTPSAGSTVEPTTSAWSRPPARAPARARPRKNSASRARAPRRAPAAPLRDSRRRTTTATNNVSPWGSPSPRYTYSTRFRVESEPTQNPPAG